MKKQPQRPRYFDINSWNHLILKHNKNKDFFWLNTINFLVYNYHISKYKNLCNYQTNNLLEIKKVYETYT